MTDQDTPRTSDRARLAIEFYRRFDAGDRAHVEALLTDDFQFSSPPDPSLDREGFFEKCWPGAGRGDTGLTFVRLIEDADELVITYERDTGDGSRGRNTEVLTFRGEQVCRSEVYFGWTS
ncbi:nuclear transport factor 2 family protein [Jatrophihabitans sp.]|uniref:nuclear transport factor 2 family protein n=1 Tax=Jatrophihabitans sp. TaxID=1932789 RepID=UPI0030C7174C|nr:hypothetical protein [Jatrophihabitans sp.]